MSATLTVSRTNLSLSDLVLGVDPNTGFTLDPQLSIGSVTWRKTIADRTANVAGRQMIDYTREECIAAGSVTCYGSTETDLQSKIATLITALTQIDATAGFQPFTMTYTHGTATYSWTCTEPADVTPTTGSLDDAEMAVFIQSFRFEIQRDPVALSGPI